MGKPKIRFKGFTEEWEQRKLGEYVEITSGDSPAKFCEGDINYVKVDDLNYAYKTVLQTQHKVSQNNSVKMVLAGSVIFPKRGAAILTNKVRVLGVDSYMDTNMMALSSEMLDTDFLYILLSKEGLYKIADTSTIPQINNKHIEPYEICLPKLDEQKMIGQYFSNLDHLITLHQRKCDETKKLKKYMLQKMFPQNGMKFPEIRFEGFTSDWEQRKLGDVFQEYSEKNHPELQALTIIQGGGTVLREESDRNLQYDKLNLSGYKMVCENDFIVHLRSFEGGLEKSNHNGLISPAYHTFHGENVDSRFYYSYFRSYEFIKHKLVPHVYGIRDGRSIDIDGMRTIKIPYTSCDEQKKIGDYIESLDTLITLHQRKCDELMKIKKYMLQNMFV